MTLTRAERWEEKLDHLARKRGLTKDDFTMLGYTGTRIRSTDMRVDCLWSWMDVDGLAEDFVDRLCNLHHGLKNEWKIIGGMGHESSLFYGELKYIIRPIDTLVDRFVEDGNSALYSYVSMIQGEPQGISLHSDGIFDLDLQKEEEKWMHLVQSIADVIPSPDNPLNSVEGAQIVAEIPCNYRGESIHVYEEHNFVLVGFLGWTAITIDQVRKHIKHYPKDVQNEFAIWESLK